MTYIASRLVIALTLFAALAYAFAFEWTAGEFPTGDQSYTLEFSFGSGEAAQSSTVHVDLVDQGGSYDLTTTVTTVQQLAPDELDLSVMAGGGMGVLAPTLMYGPMFMFLPLMLEDQDIAVRSEPIVVMGMGELHMERTEQVAGFECVVVRFEQPNNPEFVMEFALAEDLPFPCFSRYGQGEQLTEVRLVEATF